MCLFFNLITTKPPPKSTLKTTTLKDLPLYQAISYAWSEDAASQLIVVNGMELRLRTNLEECLRRLCMANNLALGDVLLNILPESASGEDGAVEVFGKDVTRALVNDVFYNEIRYCL